jgi:hypothetical protein
MEGDQVAPRICRALALLLAALVLGWLAWLTWRSGAVQDADEAVHSIEALRLADALRHDSPSAFLEKAYFPERWAPPVQNHLRWYAPLHSWIQAASLLAFGASDFAARAPSIAMLALALWAFWAVARKLAPERPELAGLCAVALAIASPNLLTFGNQALIESTSLAACWLALLAWLWSLESAHAPRRALVAGLALGLSFLAKYDHGLLLVAVLGISELLRARFHPLRLMRSGASIAFGVFGLVAAAWLGHPDKLAAFLDAVRHPFYGSPRLIALNLAATWFFEHSSSAWIGLLLMLTPLLALSDVRDERRRVLWLYATLSFVLLASRARFLFRYDYSEAPAFLVLAAVHLPRWIGAVSRGFYRRALVWRTALAGTLLAGLLGFEGLFRPAVEWCVERAFRALYAAVPSHLGLSLAPEAYLTALFAGLRRAWPLLGPPASLGAFALLLFFFLPGLHGARATPIVPRAFVWAGFWSALLIGLGFLLARLPWMVAWELEGPRELGELTRTIAAQTPQRATVLLGGGWDQYANNTLRWYLLAQSHRAARFDDVRVEGDMIGSIVLPEEPRIAWWTNRLATAPWDELPERVVLVDAHDDFRYAIPRGAEVELYRDALQRRGGWQLLETRELPWLGASLEIYARSDRSDRDIATPPIAGWSELAPGAVPRPRAVGVNGWSVKDDSWRMLRAPRFGPPAPTPPAPRSALRSFPTLP